ncbi:HD-GYP domain-containing protein [Clostridium neuense]|uniref:HD-GYP domain-containing protein n=1 Tax=Clostridium neuense TaxID=1728934 RepID=A0ABW8TAC6_9CLOT
MFLEPITLQLILPLLAILFAIYTYNKSKTKYDDLLHMVNCLINTIEAKSPVTYMHTERVCIYALKLGKALNLSKKDMLILKEAALLHDIGKLGIPDKILEKPDRLTDSEFEVIKNHPRKGYNIIKSIENLKPVAELVLCHHEKYDGSGYPNKLSGDAIPYLAKIITIADSFDVMTSRRPYKDPSSIEIAISELEKCKWTQFDGNMVDVFIKVLKTDKDIQNVMNRSFPSNID